MGARPVLQKYLYGLAFGAGFGIAASLVLLFGPGLFMAVSGHHGIPVVESRSPAATAASGKPERQFHEESVDEQIRQSSVIAIGRYERDPDGKLRMIFKEFLKKAPGTEIYYEIGDEYEMSYRPQSERKEGEGMLFFFVGSPADMRMSMTYHGERIAGLGDIPLKLFRQKCQPGIAASGSMPKPGSYGFDWLNPESAQCREISAKDISSMKQCTDSPNAFGVDIPSKACRVDEKVELIVYATKEQCQQGLETMQANAP
jgi:hypothetical protein